MSQEQQFKHTPLADPAHQFRVVKITSSSDKNTIRCRLSLTSIQNADGSYYALSYLWGPEQPTFDVQIDGKAFQVRENLWHFLERAQTRFPNVPFFIDAICIDQVNILERNKQVQMTGQIYEDADVTIA